MNFITGDQDHKSCIIPNPDVKSVPLDGDEDFVILACDGLWDLVKPEEAAGAVYDHISRKPGKKIEVLSKIGLLSLEVALGLIEDSVGGRWRNNFLSSMETS